MDRVQHAIRNRFHRHDKHGDDKREHAKGDHQNEQDFHMVDGKEMEDSSTGPENTVIDGNHDNQEGKVTTEVGVYEQQLTQLQEQLVSAMIENQTLTSQLREFTEKNKVDELKEDLEKEREKCQQLQLKLDAARVRVSSTGSEVGGVEAADVTQGVEVASPADDFVHVTNVVTAPDLQSPPKPTLLGRVWEWFIVGVYQLLEDLEPLETKSEEEEEGPELTVKQLKENIKRFKDALTPYIRTIKGINNLLTWKSPSFTGLVFALYMYMVYCGYLLPFTLFLLSLRLGVNCLRHRGLNLPFNYLDCGEEEKKDVEEKEIGMSDKFNLVLFVARKVQNILGSLADSLEKIKNLLMWNEPMAARKLLSVLLTGFCFSLYFPASTLFYFGGLYFGLKLFVIDFIYGRYPRIKHKHDTTYIIWLSLPTNEELQKRNTKSEIHKHILRNASSEPDMSFNSSTDHITSDDKSFCELFSFPLSECPLPGWHGGRRCTLINRDKSLTSAFKNGRLFLTRSFLCFERSKTPTPKNLVIPLSEISKVERAKPYSWMPGGGMAIEITLGSSDKHMVFGAFLNRDETFTSIMSAGLKGEQPWATTTTTDSPTGSPALRRSFKSSQHHKVSKHSTL